MPRAQSFKYGNPVGFKVPITAPSTANTIVKIRRAVKPAASTISASVTVYFEEEMEGGHVVVGTRGDWEGDGDVDEHVGALVVYGQRSVSL